ncbi:hypothetical protein [Fundidesulfovibrio terrae]|uniref:hypothetical protein n=1 Tax=Fundidesulfovibrio terrae TaxID=2922866 RepID=UPI001FAF61C2|nr:hypothetical protein [Fundidesulfovibrio terrae]
MHRRSVLFLLAFVAWISAGCSQEPPQPRVYENAEAGVRFYPSRGWDVAEKTEEGCLFAVEATNGPDLRFLICVSPPRPEILFTQNTFVSCENVKQYIAEALKGIRPTCSRGGAGGSFGYDTLYARRLQAGSRVRVQFVNHLFIPLRGRLVQVMAYAIGDDDKAAHELFDANRNAFFNMMGSVRLR